MVSNFRYKVLPESSAVICFKNRSVDVIVLIQAAETLKTIQREEVPFSRINENRWSWILRIQLCHEIIYHTFVVFHVELRKLVLKTIYPFL